MVCLIKVIDLNICITTVAFCRTETEQQQSLLSPCETRKVDLVQHNVYEDNIGVGAPTERSQDNYWESHWPRFYSDAFYEVRGTCSVTSELVW